MSFALRREALEIDGSKWCPGGVIRSFLQTLLRWTLPHVSIAVVRERSRFWLAIVYDPIDLSTSEALVEPMLSIDEHEWRQLVSSRDEALRWLDWEPS